MPNFSNVNDLNNYIRKMAKQALRDDVARKVHSIINKYILEEVYNKYSPEEYQRTYGLLHSLTIGQVIETGNVLSVEIFIPDEFVSHWTILGSQSLEYNAGDKVSVSEVANWISEGYTWNRQPADFMDKSLEELKSSLGHLTSFIGYLKSHGINVK